MKEPFSKRRLVVDPLFHAARVFPDSLALVGASFSLNYLHYHFLVEGCAKQLESLGIVQGSRVALVMSPSLELFVLTMALFRRGAVACPLNLRLPTLELVKFMKRISCDYFLADIPLEAEVPEIRIKDFSFEGERDFSKTYIDLDSDATVMFTSGTSTMPKAVLHSYGNHYYSALGSNENIPLKPNDRWLFSLPFYHVGGFSILIRCLFAGATVVLAEGKDLSKSIEKYRVSHVSLVFTQLQRIVDNSYPSIKSILLGGSAIPQELLEKAYKRGLPLFVSYGLTEMASQVTTTHRGALLRDLFTSGKLLREREIKISSEGEIFLRGKTLFKGYLGERQRDEEWFATGDLGFLDERGFLHVKGRCDNMFISGGENIYPEEVEAALLKIPGICRVIVIPFKDNEFGFRPIAFVDGENIVKIRLQEKLEKLLPRFKIPKEIFPWPKDFKEGCGIKISRTKFLKQVQKLLVK